MSENETTTYSSEELQKLWDALPESITTVINGINEKIDVHNRNIARIKAATGEESKKLLFELRDQNPGEDKELAKFLNEIEKLRERTEQIIKQANERAQSVYADQLKMPTEEELKTARDAVSTSGTELRAAAKSTVEFEKFLGQPIQVHLKTIQSLKGTGARSTGTTGEVWRPRTSAIYVNDELIQADVQNPKTGIKEPKSTFNIVAAHLNKQTNSKDFNTVDLQKAYLASAGGNKDSLPETAEFTLPYVKGDVTVEFKVRVVKA